MEQSKIPNVVIEEYNGMIVFTTNDREAAKLLELVCEDNNTHYSDDGSDFSFQGWIQK